jgi:hypothetical protein
LRFCQRELKEKDVRVTIPGSSPQNVDGGDFLDGGLPGQLVPDVVTHGPNWAGSLILQEGPLQVVGVFGQVFIDWILHGPASGFVVAGGCVSRDRFVGGKLFLESEDHGPHVPGVEAGDDGLGSVVVFGWKDVASLQKFIVGGDSFEELGQEGPLENGEEGLLVDGLHDDVCVGVVAVGELHVVESYAPLPVVLFE